jgi:hypothetical protein
MSLRVRAFATAADTDPKAAPLFSRCASANRSAITVALGAGDVGLIADLHRLPEVGAVFSEFATLPCPLAGGDVEAPRRRRVVWRGPKAIRIVAGAIVLAVAMCFTTIRVHDWFATISTVLLGAVIFSLAGFVNAVYAKKFDDIAIIPTFVRW